MHFAAAVLCLAIAFASAADDRLYVDLGWRGRAGAARALNAAGSLRRRSPETRVEFLFHGHDLTRFADGFPNRSSAVRHHAADLAAEERVTFVVCERALVFRHRTPADLPKLFRSAEHVPNHVQMRRRQDHALLQPESTVRRIDVWVTAGRSVAI